MAQPSSQYGVKISGDSVESLQFTIQRIDDILVTQPSLVTEYFYQENHLTRYFYSSQFIEADIVREMQKAIRNGWHGGQEVDFSDLNTMESLLTFSQANQLLLIVYAKLQLALRKGHLSKGTSTQLAKQRKSFLEALSTTNKNCDRQLLIGRHHVSLHPNFEQQPSYLVIADVPASLHAANNSTLLEKEIGEIELRINLIFNVTIELDLELFDQQQVTFKARHMIQNPQFNYASGVIFVPIKVQSLSILTLQHFYVEGKQRPLMPDELDYRQRESDKLKPQRHSYLCSILPAIPPEDRLAVVVSGASVHDMHFYSQLIDEYIHRLTSLRTLIITRTVNVPLERHQTKDKVLQHHHHHAIYHVVYALDTVDVTPIQVALGLGKRSVQRPLADQPKLHYLDTTQTIAVFISKDYTSLHNRQYPSQVFSRTGFEVSNLDMLFFPYIEQALLSSATYQQWKTNPDLVAIFGVPAYAPKSRGRLLDGTLSLRFLCVKHFEPVASHALDAEFRRLSSPGSQPLYYSLTVDVYNNLPPYFRPQLQLLSTSGYKTDPVSIFKATDVHAAKLTHGQQQPALQQVYLPVPSVSRTPTRFAEQFLAEQQRLHTPIAQCATTTSMALPLSAYNPLATSTQGPQQVNTYTTLQTDSDEDNQTEQLNATSPSASPNLFPSYLSQATWATGAGDTTLSQQTSALVFPELSTTTRAQQDKAATAAANEVNINPELRDIYAAVIEEEEVINTLQQSLVSQMLPSVRRGKITPSDQLETQQLLIQLASKKATYIRSVITVPATTATSTDREGLAIQVKQGEIDTLLARTDLRPEDYLDIIYKHHQIKWRQVTLQKAATNNYDLDIAQGTTFQLTEQGTDVVKEMELIRKDSALRTGIANPVDLTNPQETHASLVTSITALQAQLTSTQGQLNSAAKKEYKALVRTLKFLRHEHTQLAQLASMLCSPFTGMHYATDHTSPTKAHATRSSSFPNASNSIVVRMQVDEVSELAKRKLVPTQPDPK